MSTTKEFEIEVSMNDTDRLITVEFEMECTSHGSPASYASLNYPGHPAEGPEFQVDEVRFDICGVKFVATDEQAAFILGEICYNNLTEQALEWAVDNYDGGDYEPDYD